MKVNLGPWFVLLIIGVLGGIGTQTTNAQTSFYTGTYEPNSFLLDTFDVTPSSGTNLYDLAEHAMELGLDLPRGASLSYMESVGIALVHTWEGHERFQDLLRKKLYEGPTVIQLRTTLERRDIRPPKIRKPKKVWPDPVVDKGPMQELSALALSGRSVEMKSFKKDEKSSKMVESYAFQATPTLAGNETVDVTFRWTSRSFLSGTSGIANLDITNTVRVSDGQPVELFRRRVTATEDEVLTLRCDLLNPDSERMAELVPEPAFFSMTGPVGRKQIPTTWHIGLMGKVCFNTDDPGLVNEIVKAGFDPESGGLDFDVDTQTITHLNFRPKHVELVNLLREYCRGGSDHIELTLSVRMQPPALTDAQRKEQEESAIDDESDLDRWRRAPARQSMSTSTLSGNSARIHALTVSGTSQQDLVVELHPELDESAEHILVSFDLIAETKSSSRISATLASKGVVLAGPGKPALLHSRQVGDTREGWFLECNFLDRKGRPADRFPFGFEIREEPQP